MLTQSVIEGLTRQVFIRDTILNGMFPANSSIVRSFRGRRREWTYNHEFEYRMLLATSNTGGTINSQVFNPDVSLRNPNNSLRGIFKATFGTVTDGYEIDMFVNLITDSDRGSFINDYSDRVHGMRVNIANLSKNFFINGRYGVVHRISADNELTVAGLPGGQPTLGVPFRLRTPINVFATGHKTGRYLIKTHGAGGTLPWGPANVGEVYLILDSQPKWVTLCAVGTVVTPWQNGQFLELFGNRMVTGGISTPNWNPAPVSWPVITQLPHFIVRQWMGTGVYDVDQGGVDAATGAFEGLADLFPWHIDPNTGGRAGLDRPFRNQTNRLFNSAEMAGHFYVREPNETIIDAIMNGVALTTAANVSQDNVGVWINPETMLAMGLQETDNTNWVKQITSSAPMIYQRGTTSYDIRIGSRVIPGTLEDYNLPTNIIVIGPRDDISYNSIDNAFFEIDRYIQDTWSTTPPPAAENLALPADFVSSIDLRRRITYGAPTLSDLGRLTEFPGGNFVHPSNKTHVAFHEAGALFTESPFAYTVINLRHELMQPSDVHNWVD